MLEQCPIRRLRATGENDNDPTDLAMRQIARPSRGAHPSLVRGHTERVAILVASGFSDSGPAVALDVLRTANVLCRRAGDIDRFEIEIVSARGGRVPGASGLALASTVPIRRAARASILMVPGIWAEGTSDIDRMLAKAETRMLVRAIAAASRRGALVASSCSGAFLLAGAGVLDGREATTTWWLAAHLAQLHPKVRVDAGRALVADGNAITAGAVFAQADVALRIVSRYAGPTIAQQCASVLLLDTHPSQAPYMAVAHLRSDDRTVRRAESWVRAHLHEPFDLAELARSVGTSPRTLARRLAAAVGLSPIAFVQRLRVEAAVRMLRTTRLSLQEISTRVGYADPNTLRRLVHRETSATPRELRQRSARS
jgi:transcriptional regulator GlxA family with amidase domain